MVILSRYIIEYVVTDVLGGLYFLACTYMFEKLKVENLYIRFGVFIGGFMLTLAISKYLFK